MAGTDMLTRILKMYEILKRGREIQKLSFCEEHGISERTFERDIEKIRIFLSEIYSGYEVVYCSWKDSYYIPDIDERGSLSVLEATLILKIIKGGHILEKSEFIGLSNSLLSVIERGKKKEIQKLIQELPVYFKE